MMTYANILSSNPHPITVPLSRIISDLLRSAENAELDRIAKARRPRRGESHTKWTRAYRAEVSEMAVEIVAKHAPISSSAVARVLTESGHDVSTVWVCNALQRLAEDGRVKSTGNGRYLKWMI